MDGQINKQLTAEQETFYGDFLSEIEHQTSEEIKAQRNSQRITIKTPVILKPGNLSEVPGFKVQGVSGDISAGGMGGVFPIPVNVGDVYRMSFDKKVLDIPVVFARCLRCKMIRENAFEAGFSFFSPIELNSTMDFVNMDSLLI